MRTAIFLGACFALLVAVAIGCSTTQSPQRQVNDSKITTQVKSKLASNVRVTSLANVDVNTTNGIVTLAGQVESEEVKREAEQAARGVPGVVGVNNNLQVAPPIVGQQGKEPVLEPKP
jgi:osmotically-inducible protein OsmY